VKIFWDTNLFISLWERKSFAAEMDKLTAFMEEGGHKLAASTLTLGEILVHPARIGNAALFGQYRQALERLTLLPFDTGAAVLFAELRALHGTLRPPDAIQISCALAGQCDLFLTNDERLAGLDLPPSLRIQSLREWSKANRPA
jgi:predicted nucleic acid-binding protein